MLQQLALSTHPELPQRCPIGATLDGCNGATKGEWTIMDASATHAWTIWRGGYVPKYLID